MLPSKITLKVKQRFYDTESKKYIEAGEIIEARLDRAAQLLGLLYQDKRVVERVEKSEQRDKKNDKAKK